MINNSEITAATGLYDEFLQKFQKNEKLCETNLQSNEKAEKLNAKVKIKLTRKKKSSVVDEALSPEPCLDIVRAQKGTLIGLFKKRPRPAE